MRKGRQKSFNDLQAGDREDEEQLSTPGGLQYENGGLWVQELGQVLTNTPLQRRWPEVDQLKRTMPGLAKGNPSCV